MRNHTPPYNYLGALFSAVDAHADAVERARLAERLLQVARAPEGWRRLQCGILDRNYVEFLGKRLLVCYTKRPPSKAREALLKLSEQLECGKGRFSHRGKHRDYARILAASVHDLALLMPRGKVGNPSFTLRGPQSTATRVIKELLDQQPPVQVTKYSRAGRALRQALKTAVSERLPHGDDQFRDPVDLIRATVASPTRAKERAKRRWVGTFSQTKKPG